MVPSPYESVNQYPWVPDEATSEHKTLVEEVIAKLNEAPNITYLEKASGWVVSKRLVMKYAQAVGWKNSSNVASMILEVMQWRVDYGVTDIVASEFDSIARRCPFYILGRDNLGRPIIYVDFYRFKKEDPDYCLRYMVFTMERAAQIFQTEKGEQRVVIVVDCSGFRPAPDELYSEYNAPGGKLKSDMSAASAKMMARIMSLYYKEFNGCAIGSDAGFAVNTLYKAVKYIVEPETRKKIMFEPHKEVCNILNSMAPPEEVIQQYGGKLDLEYNALAYLYHFDFKTAHFASIGTMAPTISSAFIPTQQATTEPPETSEDVHSLLPSTVYYSARDHFDDASKTELVHVDRGSIVPRNGKFISINVNNASDLEERLAQMSQWISFHISGYMEEDKDAFQSAWDESSPRPNRDNQVSLRRGSRPELLSRRCCCTQ